LDELAIKNPGSPEWWLDRLLQRFHERDHTYDVQIGTGLTDSAWRQPVYWRTRRERLNMLWAYYIGRPPLPRMGEKARETFRDVIRTARANYAPKAIGPVVDRMELIGVRTGVTDGVEGDEVAKKIMDYSNGTAAIKDALTFMLVMSEAYLMVIPAAEGAVDQTPLITAEDPRTCIGEPDPMNPNHLRAAVKLGYDPMTNKVMAWLFHDGWKYTASCAGSDMWALSSYGAASFDWDSEPVQLKQLDAVASTVPIIQLTNLRGMGEFEPFLDVLDRINDGIMRRIQISAYQAAKQRAIIGDLEGDEMDDDAPAEDIDWDHIFDAAPDALWRVPAGTTFWESGPTDLTGVLTSIRDDVKEFAINTDTPLHLVSPDSANQTAEGASALREGLVFKVKDRRGRTNPRLSELFKMAFAFANESARTSSIELIWGPIESFSLTEKGQVASQTRGILSRNRVLQDIFEMTPDQIQQNEQELRQDAIVDAALGAAGAGSVRVTESTTDRVTGKPSNGMPVPSVP
jgi:hypothetical protein